MDGPANPSPAGSASKAPSNPKVLWRGVLKRCGRCGTKAPFHRYFKLGDHCTGCGYRFAREEGFFTGVYLMNYGVTAVVIVAVVMVYLFAAVTAEEGISTVPFLVAGIGLAIAVPIAYYPYAATTWAAIDLVMRPLEPVEIAEAEVRLAETAGTAGSSPTPTGPG